MGFLRRERAKKGRVYRFFAAGAFTVCLRAVVY